MVLKVFLLLVLFFPLIVIADSGDSLEPFGTNPGEEFTNNSYYNSFDKRYVFEYSGADKITYSIYPNRWEVKAGYINVETDMHNEHSTCYIRIPFTVDGGELPYYSSLELRVRYDDGFVAYINGTEVQRVNFTGTPQWDSTASSDHEASASWDVYNISTHLGTLQADPTPGHAVRSPPPPQQHT